MSHKLEIRDVNEPGVSHVRMIHYLLLQIIHQDIRSLRRRARRRRSKRIERISSSKGLPQEWENKR